MIASCPVLSCPLQEDHLEVPFIWSYRKDYLHPEMKRAHVWFVLEQDEKWEALHAARLKANREMQALCDAAAGGLHDVRCIIACYCRLSIAV